MKIRKAQVGDLPECVALSKIPEFSSINLKTDKEMKKYLKEYILKGFFLVAEENDTIIGFIAAEKMLGKVAWIDALTTKKELRGKGIGKMLLNKMREELKKNKIQSVCLMAPKFNLATQKFYESAGLTRGKDFVEFTEEFENLQKV